MLEIYFQNNGILLQLKSGFSLYAFKSPTTDETVVKVSLWMGYDNAPKRYIESGKVPLFRALVEASKLSSDELMGWV